MDGRDVEALDTQRRRVERQRALQLQQRLVGAVVGVPGAHHVAHERMAGVPGAHVEQPALLAALRTVQDALAPALLAEPLAYQLGIGKVDSEVDLGGDVCRLVVVALHKARDQLLLGHVEALVQDELAGAHRAALAHHEHAGARDGLLAVEPDQVDVHARGKHHLLTVVQAADHLEAPLDAPGPLKVELGCRCGHVGLQLAHQLGALTGEEPLHPVHVLGILLATDHAGAHAWTAPHVVIETGSPLLGAHELDHVGILGALLEQAPHVLPARAGGIADGHHLAQGIDGLAGGAGIRIGAKVARAALVLLAGVLDGREHIAHRERDVGIALVVLEVDVEIGVVLLDQVAFEHQGLVLAFHHHVVKRGHELHHEGDLLAVVGERDVLLHAGAQVFGLAHIDNLARGVFPQVATRAGGHLRHLLGNGGDGALGRLGEMPRRRVLVVRPHGAARRERCAIAVAPRHAYALAETTSPMCCWNFLICLRQRTQAHSLWVSVSPGASKGENARWCA